MHEEHWQGALWLGRDHCLLAGVSGSARPHAHYAHQLLLATGEPLQLSVEGRACSGHALLVPSQRAHAFELAGQPLLALYAEPLAFSVEQLQVLAETAPAEMAALAGRVRQLPRAPLDARVRQALDAVDEQLVERVSARDLAQRVCLSLSQLERLFADQVGLSVRRLVRWRRLRLALVLALNGATLTEAAHAAGFADSAHLSRTVRELFGIRADRSLRHLRLRLLD
ncbi:AraC family transcriptional regulator [Pseudomonas paralcaligenes]|uniref:AraC family transcriptional regulator n=1 Tax=Pseudomonas paralcaligenes TaxID=2772558 RepID=UPI001C814CD7|nr:AraC family transcriptional regulator [Pseudomonas paralcaligenes]